jgi:hypothetical protein
MSCVFGNQALCEKCKKAIYEAGDGEINSILKNDNFRDCVGAGTPQSSKDVLMNRYRFIASIVDNSDGPKYNELRRELNKRMGEIGENLDPTSQEILVNERRGGNKKRKSSKSKRSNRRKKSNRRRHTKRR